MTELDASGFRFCKLLALSLEPFPLNGSGALSPCTMRICQQHNLSILEFQFMSLPRTTGRDRVEYTVVGLRIKSTIMLVYFGFESGVESDLRREVSRNYGCGNTLAHISQQVCLFCTKT